jgi:hypothetical protein
VHFTRQWISRLFLVFCVFLFVGNIVSAIVAVFTGHWATIPVSLVFAFLFAFLARSNLQASGLVTRAAPAPDPAPAAAVRDPGWGFSLRTSGRDGLSTLRSTFVSFAVAIVLFGIVIAYMDQLPNGPVLPWVAILAVMAVASVVAERSTDRPLLCDSPARLAGSYRTRFFLRVALAESVALFAFAFSFIDAPAWIYYVGAAFTLVRFATTVAPTRAALARDQARLDAAGCDLSLVAALMDSRAP